VFREGELQQGGIAAIFWLLAIAIWRVSRIDALGSIALALLVQFILEKDVLICVGVTCLLVLSGRWLCNVLPISRTASACIAAVTILGVSLYSARHIPKDGPYQYEAAARNAARIKRDFSRNTWLIISPVQELALTYGRGWHLELSEFVDTHTIEQVSEPAFRFKYPVANTFLFLEKKPLASPQLSLTLPSLGQAFDPTIAPYHLRLSRASLQFRAARLIAAYIASHTVEIYHEDDELVVFRLL
jgi:hypothetical protein